MAYRVTKWGVGTEAAFPTISAGTAGFRTVCATIEQHILNAGLVRVPCTGELDLDTYVLPSGYTVNTVYGFRVYRFADVLQNTAPVFLRVDYGTGFATGTSVLTVSLWGSAGSSVSATGVLGGRNTGAPVQCLLGSGSNFLTTGLADIRRLYSGGNTSRLAIAGMFNPSGSTRQEINLLGIERIKSATGSDSNVGFVLVTGSRTQSISFSTSPVDNPPREEHWHAIVSTNSPSTHLNRRSVGFIVPFNGDSVNPITAFGVVRSGDMADDEVVTVNTYNASAQYLTVEGVMTGTLAQSIHSSSGSIKFLVRID